ncbi:MAG: TRAP transporter small permease [bacterium]
MRNIIDSIIEKMLIFLMSFLVINVLWQVGSRYLMKDPSSFTDELAGFLLIWVGLLGAAYVAGKRGHLAIDLLLRKVNNKQKRTLEIIINLFIIIFSLTVLIIGGFWLVYTRFYLGVKSAALELPLGYVYIVLPMAGILITYYNSDNIIQLLKKEIKSK